MAPRPRDARQPRRLRIRAFSVGHGCRHAAALRHVLADLPAPTSRRSDGLLLPQARETR